MDAFLKNLSNETKNSKQVAGYIIRYYEEMRGSVKDTYKESMYAQRDEMMKKLEARKQLRSGGRDAKQSQPQHHLASKIIEMKHTKIETQAIEMSHLLMCIMGKK